MSKLFLDQKVNPRDHYIQTLKKLAKRHGIKEQASITWGPARKYEMTERGYVPAKIDGSKVIKAIATKNCDDEIARLQTHIRQLEANLSRQDPELEAQLQRNTAQLRQLQTAYQALESKLKKTEENMVERMNEDGLQIIQLKDQLKTANSSEEEYIKRIEDLVTRLTDVRQQLDELKKQRVNIVQSADVDPQQLQKIAQLQKELEAVRAEKAKLEQDSDAAQKRSTKRITILNDEVIELRNKIETCNSDLKKCKGDTEQLRELVYSLRQEEEDAENLRQQLKNNESKLATLSNENKRLQKQLEERGNAKLRKDYEDNKALCQAIERTNDGLRQALGDLKAEMKAKLEDAATQLREAQAAAKRCQVDAQRLSDLTNQVANLQEVNRRMVQRMQEESNCKNELIRARGALDTAQGDLQRVQAELQSSLAVNRRLEDQRLAEQAGSHKEIESLRVASAALSDEIRELKMYAREMAAHIGKIDSAKPGFMGTMKYPSRFKFTSDNTPDGSETNRILSGF